MLDATNVVITDPLITELEFVAGSVLIGDAASADSPATGINVGTVSAEATKKVTFDVIIKGVPDPNPYVNKATISYDDGTGETKEAEVEGNGLNIGPGGTANLGNSTKDVDNASPKVGDTVTYTVSVENTGSLEASAVVILDALPEELVYVPGTATIGGATTTDNPTTGINITNVGVGETVEVKFDVLIEKIPTENPYSNKVTISYDDGTGKVVENEVTGKPIDITNPTVATLGNSTKNASTTNPTVGDTIKYTVVINNSGALDATGVIAKDALVAGVEFVQGSVKLDNATISGDIVTGINVGTVAAGETKTLTFDVKFTAVPQENPYKNTLQLSYDDGTGTVVTDDVIGNEVNVDDGVTPKPDLTTSTKKVSDQYASIGENVKYTVVIENTGDAEATDLVIKDILPSGLKYMEGSTILDENPSLQSPITGITITSLGIGGSATISFDVTIESAPTVNPVVNNLSIDYKNPDGTNGNVNLTSTGVQVNSPDFSSGTKKANKKYVEIGEEITYTITLPNTGTVPAIDVVLSDSLPNGTEFVPGSILLDGTLGSGNPSSGINIGNISAGSTKVVTFDLKVVSIPETGTIINTAKVDYSYTENPANPNGASGESNVGPTEPIEVNTPSIGEPGNATKEASTSNVKVGDTITFTITLDNSSGTVDATNVLVTDAMPEGTVFVPGTVKINNRVDTGNPENGINVGVISAGEIAIITFDTLVESIPESGTIVNTADYSYNFTKNPNNPGGGTGGGTTPPTPPVEVKNPDLTTSTKTSSPKNAALNDIVEYTITVSNTGTAAANNVEIKDILPNSLEFVLGSTTIDDVSRPYNPSSIIIPTVGVDQTKVVKFKVKVISIPENPVVNEVDIDYVFTKDPLNPNGESGSVNIKDDDGLSINSPSIVDPSNVTKTADVKNVALGDEITFTVELDNSTGNVAATNVVVTDNVPDGTEFVPGSVKISETPVDDNAALGINVGTIAAGSLIKVEFKLKVVSIPTSGSIVNTADYSFNFTKDPSNPNGENGGGTTEPTDEINVNTPDFGGGSDPTNPENFKKTTNKEFAEVGEIITYSFYIKNGGNVAATNTILKDLLSDSLEFVVGSVEVNNALVDGSPVLGINLGTIAPGQEKNISFMAEVKKAGLISNKGELTYNFTKDPANPNGASGQVESNENEITASNAKLSEDDVKKEANKTITTVGDIITYTVTVNNNTSGPLANVMVKDKLSSSLEFVDKSLKVNDLLLPNANIVDGIIIESILKGEIVKVMFDARVKENATGPISNTAEIDYQYKTDPNGDYKDGSVLAISDPIENINAEDGFILVKKADKQNAIVGDIIRYTIDITNSNPLKLDNVIITDRLTPELEVIGNVKIDGAATGQNILDGINLGSIDVNKSVKVSYDALVKSRPVNGVIKNAIESEFDFNIDKTFSGSKEANEEIFVYNADIKTSKKANTNIVKVGETFEYIITMSNEGNIRAENVLVSDSLPVEFEVLEVKVNDALVQGNIENGIDIGALEIGETKVVRIIVKVNGLAEGFVNIAKAIIEFKPDPNAPESKVEVDIIETDQDGNPGGIKVINPRLKMVKTTKQAAAAVGEVIDYEVVITNIGNVDALDVKVSDLLSQNLEFVMGSVKINGKTNTDANINTGVTIPSLKVGEMIKLEFKAKILGKDSDLISNQALASYEFLIDDEKQFTEDKSNINELNVRLVNLNIVKTSNVDFAVLNDEIEYTITIENDGEVTASKILLKDKMPKYIELIPGTFKINNVRVNSIDLEKGVVIGDIPVGETVVVTYKTKVIGTACNAKLINSVSAEFIYDLDGLATGEIIVTGEESENSIDMGISTFKQLSIEEELQIPNAKPDIETLNEMTGTIEIINCHLIETGSLVSQEGQKLTGFKLVISGYLNIVVKYTALDMEQSVHSAHYKVPFSTFVVMPNEYNVGSKLDVEGIVEDIYFKAHDERCFFTNTTALINVKILDC